MTNSSTISEYARLLSSTLPAVIRSEAENERCIRRLEELDRKGNLMSAAERHMSDLLTLLIEDFEEKHYALTSASPAESIKELMLANGLKQKDLLDVFGTASIVSDGIAWQAPTHYGAYSPAKPSIPCFPGDIYLSSRPP